MNARLIMPLVACWFWFAPGRVPADADTLPMPRVWNEDGCKKVSSAEFERQLQQLKAERAALLAEWKALLKRSAEAAPRGDGDNQLQRQLKEALYRLQQSRLPAAPPRELAIGTMTDALPAVAPKTTAPPVTSNGETEPAAGPVDALAQGHTLFRAHQYEEALASFRLVDLKGKKAEARAPVQYLMAVCLLHLGKAEEAVPLMRDVANARGDEKLAGYAQWQLDMLRWQRDLQDRLQGYRQRRLALEKKS